MRVIKSNKSTPEDPEVDELAVVPAEFHQTFVSSELLAFGVANDRERVNSILALSTLHSQK